MGVIVHLSIGLKLTLIESIHKILVCLDEIKRQRKLSMVLNLECKDFCLEFNAADGIGSAISKFEIQLGKLSLDLLSEQVPTVEPTY